LGSGGFGTVFLAQYQNMAVAVKEPHNAASIHKDEYRKRAFCREADHLYRLRHPNIVNFVGAIVEDEHHEPCYCIVTEVLPFTLEAYLTAKATSSISVGQQVIFDLATGLSYMHASKIIHRDIKPQNVMVDELGRAKYIDFGLSKEEELSRQTSASYTMVGTQSWMAPEVKKGEKATAASDVYSLGM
ncbi:hypothetical protein GUITHDRAFT_43113, partial [Guillardia theta CCMP2712]